MSLTSFSNQQFLKLLTLQEEVGAHGAGTTGRMKKVTKTIFKMLQPDVLMIYLQMFEKSKISRNLKQK